VGLVALPFPHAQKPINSIKVHFSTSARIATNAMLPAVFDFSATTCLFESFAVTLSKVVKTKYV